MKIRIDGKAVGVVTIFAVARISHMFLLLKSAKS
jgi:hypothetical protein